MVMKVTELFRAATVREYPWPCGLPIGMKVTERFRAATVRERFRPARYW